MRLYYGQDGDVRFISEYTPYRDCRGVEKASVILSSIFVVSRLSGDYFSIMDVNLPNMSLQEQDLALFLDTLGVKFPGPAPNRADGHVVIALNPVAASVFNSKDGKTVLLGYRYQGTIFPLSIHFLSGEHETLFGHSTLLLDSYSGGGAILPILRKATELFFSHNGSSILRNLEPAWENVSLKGQVDRRIEWHMKPTLDVAVKTCMEALGEVPDIPLFPSVYSYNNPYVENLLEVGLPELSASRRVLVLGSGSGLDAACIAMKYKVAVDATDINPIAIANTKVAARRCGVEHLVRCYVSDAFDNIHEKFDTIFFEAPLATEEIKTDANRYDVEGKVLHRVLSGLPDHLLPGGRMYLMSRADLSLYVNTHRLCVKTRRQFEPLSRVAIHEISLEKGCSQ
jgi:SAM-dependent methyltransferase